MQILEIGAAYQHLANNKCLLRLLLLLLSLPSCYYLNQAHISVAELVIEHFVVLLPHSFGCFLIVLKVHKRLPFMYSKST